MRNTLSVTRSRTDLHMPSLKPAIYVAIPHPQLLFEIYVGQEKHTSNFRPCTNQNTENSWKHTSFQSALYTLSTSFLAATGSVVCMADCDTVEQLLVSSNGQEPETIIIFPGHWDLMGLKVNGEEKKAFLFFAKQLTFLQQQNTFFLQHQDLKNIILKYYDQEKASFFFFPLSNCKA